MKVEPEAESQYSVEGACFAFMHYNKSFKKIVMGTVAGRIGVLPVEAETNQEDEENEDEEVKKEVVITQSFHELGSFHTGRVTGIRELGESTQLVTISEDCSMALWEATQANSQLAHMPFGCKLTALEVSRDGNVAFIGSEFGVMRILDVSNRAMPRLVKEYNFFDSPIQSLQISDDGKYVACTAVGSDKIFLMSSEGQVVGFYECEGYVIDAGFVKHEDRTKIVATMTNGLCLGLEIPTEALTNRDRKSVV